MSKDNLQIPYWFDQIISLKLVDEKFKEKRISSLLESLEPTKGKEYVAISNPFSDRLDYYISRNKLPNYNFKIIDYYGMAYQGGNNPKLLIPHNGNGLIKLKDGFYYFSFHESFQGGSDNAELIIFVNEKEIAWDKEKIISTIFAFSKELSEFQDNKRLELSDPTAFDRIFLPGEMIENIKTEVGNFLESRKMYSDELKLPWKRGMLFVGPPGNGKTTLLRAICKYFGLTHKDIKESIRRNGDVDMPTSESKGIDMALFPTGNDVTVWIMEDIDKMVDFNGDKESLSSSVSLHDVLKGLDGINPIDGALILATTNFANILSESLAARPGRFDRIIGIEYPKKKEIVRLLEFHKMSILDIDNGVDKIASKLEGYSMAFAEEYVKSVKMIHRKNDVTVEESNEILDRIIKHNKEFENKFEEKGNGGFGFGK